MSFVTVLIIIAVVAFVAYKNKDKILSLLDKARDVAKPVPVQAPVNEVSKPAPSETQPAITLDQVVDQATLDLYRAHLRATNPGLLAYTPIVFIVAEPSKPAPAGWNTPAVFVDGVAVNPLLRGARQIGVGKIGKVLSWPLDASATRVALAECNSIQAPAKKNSVKYQLWISKTPGGAATTGDKAHKYSYNTATINSFPAGSGYVNVLTSFVEGVPFYIQAN